MEIEAFIQKKKALYSTLLNFLDKSADFEEEFQLLIQVFDDQEILQNRGETINLFHLLSKIEENHHRTANFYEKFEQIFNYIINEKKFTISSSELFQFFKKSKRMLLLLLEKKFLIPDDSILKEILKLRDLYGYRYSIYLYSGIKPFINEQQQQEIEKTIIKMHESDIENFIKKCRIGENDSPLCKLIREDSIDDFVSYINQNNISLSTKIEQSIYETNFFLTSISKKPSLIEYASFFGSLQIVQYLHQNNAKLKGKLWYFAVHSNNLEIVRLCEENKLVSIINNFENLIKYSRWYMPEYRSESTENLRLLREAVKCHHNDIYNYVKNIFVSQNLEENNNNYDDFIESYIVDLYDYYFYPDDISLLISMKKNYHGCSISFLCSNFSKITIPSTVTKIGKDAFYGCSSLNEVEIPTSVIKIGKDAFCECSSLVEITIPSSVIKIGNRAFKGCSKLTRVIIPTSVTSIGDNAFDSCSSLVEIEIPSSITALGKSVFNGCSSLQKVEIPISVTSIGDYCFFKCLSLNEIDIPPSVISIGKHAFEGCSSLAQMIIPSSVECIDDYTFNNCSSLKKIEFVDPSSVNRIGDFAFHCCGLEKASIPSSVTIIGQNAFSDCSSLKKIAVPQSVTYIGVDAFSLGTKVI